MMSALLLAVIVLGPVGQRPGCSRAAAIAAEEGVDHLRTWSDLHAAFKQFAACDDGATGEGWSDFVVRTLARKWSTLGELERLTKNDKAFRAFVIRHIDDTTDPDDRRRLLTNARDRCPASSRTLCADLVEAAK